MLRRVKITRDTILFTAGLLGVLYQTVVEHIDRPVLLALFGTMMGLPVFLGRDEKKAAPKEPATPESPETEKAEES